MLWEAARSADFALSIITGVIFLAADLFITYVIVGVILNRREQRKFGPSRREFASELVSSYRSLVSEQVAPISLPDWAEIAHTTLRFQTSTRAFALSPDIVQAGANYDRLLQTLRAHPDSTLNSFFANVRKTKSFETSSVAGRRKLLSEINKTFEALLRASGLTWSDIQSVLWSARDIDKASQKT